MNDPRTIPFYLEEPLRQSAQAGDHNFINLMAKVLKENGLEPVFEQLPIRGPATTGNSLTHMAQPPNARGLVFRRVYHYPFWQIDTVAQRWHWDVAKALFDETQTPEDAPRFYRYWQKRLFGDAALAPTRQGFVYVPLQGKLDQQRPFQSCTPLEMIAHCLAYEPNRQIIAALHPKERYGRAELAKLNTMASQNPRLTVDTGNMEQHLKACDYVVTQNSGVAFSGFFFGKPALLFGEIDFHHIIVRADLTALGDGFAKVAQHRPAFDKYIWWFWQDQSINAGRENAAAKIAARLRRFGWPIKDP